MIEQYVECNICPRACKVNRNEGKLGFCKQDASLKIASACLHFGEEPLITVNNGSGTIFVTGCNLQCAFCQNYQISQCGMGNSVSVGDFVKIVLKLQGDGAENINIVTGSHAIPFLAEALKCAKKSGLTIPVCWNSSAYESVEALEMLKGLVDIWLPDLKTLNPMISDAVFKASDYPSVAKKAIRWMVNNTEQNIVQSNGKEKMLSGVIVRHLVLPGRLDDTFLTLDWLKKHADSKGACISVMMQYTPVFVDNALFSEAKLKSRQESLSAFNNRLLETEEFEKVKEMIDNFDFAYLFYQELEKDTEWLPDFNKQQPFSYELAKPVWHWEKGFC